jgi:alpha-ketoglutarate-dependent taurine dioxygenase
MAPQREKKMDEINTKFITSEKLPLVIEPANSEISFPQFLDLLHKKNAFFRQSLLQHGGLLFRNFPIRDEHHFSAAIQGLQMGNFINYIGGDSPRKKIVGGIYTSTEAPPSIKLPLHNELSYVKNYPKHIYFYCDTPPAADGETTIADARKIFKAIAPDVKARFIEKGLRYVSCYPYKSAMMNFVNKSHKSWINVFETEDKKEVERKCVENEIQYQWNRNDWLQISQVLPSVISHPETQEEVWFNQAHHFDFNPKFLGWKNYIGAKILYCRKHTLLHDIFFADNTRIPRKDLYHILDVLEENTVYFPWQKGDMLVLDNILAMHGRSTFTGKRRILTAMTG